MNTHWEKDHHEGSDNRGEYSVFAADEPFHQAAQAGVDHFNPSYCRDTPEQTVQQVDPPVKIKGNMAVIPEDDAEYLFSHPTAQIFVSAAQQSAGEKDIAVIFPCQPVEQHCHEHCAKAPHHAG